MSNAPFRRIELENFDYNCNTNPWFCRLLDYRNYACCEWSIEDGCQIGRGTGMVYTGEHAAVIDAFSTVDYREEYAELASVF